MKSFWKRLLLFLIAMPLLIIIIFYLPYLNYLTWAILIIVMSALGAYEASNMFKLKGININPVIALVSGSIIPIAVYLVITDILPISLIQPLLLTLMGLILVKETVFKKEQDIPSILSTTAASIALVFYPGFFISYMIRLTTFPNASLYMLFFLFLVFGNDSLAYIFGSLFGRKSKNIIVLSPNKSIVGFVGGFAGTLFLAFLWYLFLPEIFSGSLFAALAAGVVVSITANLGDLIVSAFKRSAEVKDSGNLFPGRGGVLDSIDSVLFSVPVFFYIMTYFIGTLF